jgi:hypothetical protein
MPSIKGTRTEQNLLKAFAGESQAKNRYEFAAKVAKKRGMSRSRGYFRKPRFRSSSTPSVSLNFSKAGWWKLPRRIRLVKF